MRFSSLRFPNLLRPGLPSLLVVGLLTPGVAFAAGEATHPDEVVLADYLPAGVDHDPEIPTPASVLGFEVGQRHVRHDQLVAYMERLAAASDRVQLSDQGRTHEGRRQVLLTISSPANLARIDQIQAEHRALSEPASTLEAVPGDTTPVVVWLGYSIHGNEASGANASMVVAYHLAAGRGAAVEDLLERAVVLIDPSLNPDGLARFAHWVNMYRGRRPVADPDHREHREDWPNGRTNHYWFDLNRDWLLLQHPESRARVATFQAWRPNVLADFHEMGSDSTFFFQPGVPSRRNPLTPERNVELTAALAGFHAEALDRASRLYYSEETFDDFYYGKGSTYPDIQGAVGILFEQASVRGHLRETDNGLRSFPYAIQNQTIASLSTLRGAVAHRRDLLGYQGDFYRQGLSEARQAGHAAWVFGDASDPARTRRMAAILLAHGVEVYELQRPAEAGGHRFEPGAALVVPAAQRQYRLLRAVFEPFTSFEDTIFYDVSAWTLPLAFGLPSAALSRDAFTAGLAGDPLGSVEVPPARPPTGSPRAWAFAWSGYYAPRALGRLLEAGVPARVASRPFTGDTGSDTGEGDEGGSAGRRAFPYGTIVVPVGEGGPPAEQLTALLGTIAREDGVEVFPVTRGLTAEGVDLGSPSVLPVMRPRPLLLIGDGVSTYEAGEMWHLIDHRYRLPLTLAPAADLARLDLDRYTHVLLVHGRYAGLGDDAEEALRRFVRGGGVVVATRGAGRWIDELLPRDGGEVPEVEAVQPPEATYASYESDRAAELLSGAIFEVELDLSHPMAWGYSHRRLPVFRTSTEVVAPSTNPYENVALYTAAPLLAGYSSERNRQRLAGTAAVVARRVGGGAVIHIADDPSFRGFFHGTQKLVANALFFGNQIKGTSAPEGW